MKTWSNIKQCYTEYNKKQTRYTKSETDKSKYRPNISRLNDIIGAQNTELDPNRFTFKDGKDTGERNYILTDPKFDIAEKQEYIKNILTNGKMAKSEIEKELQEIANEENNKTELNNSINNTGETKNNAN